MGIFPDAEHSGTLGQAILLLACLRGKPLEQAVERFQSEPDDGKAHEQWKKIETAVFDVTA